MKFMKLVARFVVGVALAVAAALAGLSAFFFVAGRDIDPPDVSDVLPPPRQPIADAENMVPILLDATNRLALTKDDRYFINCCYRKDGWDRRLRLADGDRTLTAQEATAWADGILASNAVLFAALDKAAERPRAQYPAAFAAVGENVWPRYDGCDKTVFGQLWHFATVDAFMYGNLVAVRARRLREQGQSETAAKELVRYGDALACLSYRMENASLVLWMRSPVLPVSDELVRTAMDETVCDATLKEIDSALRRWADGYLQAFRFQHRYCVLRARNMMPELKMPKSLFTFPEDPEVPRWFRALANGFGTCVYWFPGYRRYLFQPNRTVAELAEVIRAMERQAYSLPYTTATREFFSDFDRRHSNEIRWLSQNGYGISEVIGYSGWGSFNRLVGMSAFYRESNHVMLAMTRFRRKCKRNPQSLSELVPEFMTEVPRDPFDADMSLGYNFEQGTLHTVGANGTFNGKVRDPRLRFGGLRNPDYRYIRRIDGRSMEPPLKEREVVSEGKSQSKEK